MLPGENALMNVKKTPPTVTRRLNTKTGPSPPSEATRPDENVRTNLDARCHNLRLLCKEGTLVVNQTFCLNTKTFLTTNETTQMCLRHNLSSDHEERAGVSIVLKVYLGKEVARRKNITLLRKDTAKKTYKWSKGWNKERAIWWSDDQATDGENQSSQAKRVPTKSSRQSQKTKEIKWVEKTKVFHEARSIISEKRAPRQKSSKESQKGKKAC